MESPESADEAAYERSAEECARVVNAGTATAEAVQMALDFGLGMLALGKFDRQAPLDVSAEVLSRVLHVQFQRVREVHGHLAAQEWLGVVFEGLSSWVEQEGGLALAIHMSLMETDSPPRV